MSETKFISRGIGFVGMLTILFIALKLTSIINWTWWWVLSPIWIDICVAICLIIFVLIAVAISEHFK